MDRDVCNDPNQDRTDPAVQSLGSLTLLAYYNSYPSARIHHFCTSQWYLLILQQLQRMGYLDRAEAWFVCDKELEFVQHEVTVRCFTSFEDMARRAVATDILWVRGKCKAYVSVLKRMPARLRVYYPASKRFLSRDWPHFDLVLVDDARQVGPVTRLGAAPIVRRVIKTADPDIFRPLPNVEKQYDLCMIGGMHLTRKNHEALVPLLKSDPTLTAVLVGKQKADTVERIRATGAKVHLIDFCGRQELNRVMNSARIGFVPSLMDAAPRVIMEFMAAGVPVLLNSAILGGRDYVTRETGVLAAESEFVRAAQQMRAASQSDARRGFEQSFQPEIAARHLGDILVEAMRVGGRPKSVRPPGWMRRVVTRPFFLKRRLARCWQEINHGYPASR
jgi:glycosyltransferase involved in cell wall biosynthesis